ncbi:MAG: hypothetical protein KGN35_02505 [Betaproteobacteria bacterium]|nr:hypothetical protein [Betaproteobacteria bacterium]
MKTFIRNILIITVMSASLAHAGDDHYHPTARFGQDKLGKVHFPVSCTPGAQVQFNQAVAMLHSFWYDEAEKTFRQVTVTDPSCAMGYWGVAMSRYYQLWATPPTETELQKGREMLRQARKLPIKTEREKAYLDAVETFYRNGVEADFGTRKLLYQKAMEQVLTQNPDDGEAAVFYALALISTASPTDKTFVNQKKALHLLQKVLAHEPEHPGVAHYIIHSSDYPGLAELGLDAARSYTRIAPAAPHALHMPSHIFIRLGQWQDAAQSNLAADQAAQEHARQHASGNSWDQRFHFMDYRLYAYLQLGETGKAWDIVQQVQAIGNAQPSNTTVAYAYAAIPARYAVERGDWREAAKLRLHPADFPWQQFGWCEAIFHFAKGLGAARTGNVTDAKDSLQRLETLRDLDRSAHKDYTAGQIGIQRLAVAAWIAVAENRNEEALQLMRASADLEDATEKDNVTPGAIIPARELLGELLLTLNQPAAALQELEASLQRTPSRRNALDRVVQAAKEAGNQVKANHYDEQRRKLIDRAHSKIQ